MNMNGDMASMVVSGIFFLTVAAVFVLRGPLGKAWARRIEGTSNQPDAAALTEMQGRIAELEEHVERMHELEERLDFAERLIAQQRDRPQLEARREAD